MVRSAWAGRATSPGCRCRSGCCSRAGCPSRWRSSGGTPWAPDGRARHGGCSHGHGGSKALRPGSAEASSSRSASQGRDLRASFGITHSIPYSVLVGAQMWRKRPRWASPSVAWEPARRSLCWPLVEGSPAFSPGGGDQCGRAGMGDGGGGLSPRALGAPASRFAGASWAGDSGRGRAGPATHDGGLTEIRVPFPGA